VWLAAPEPGLRVWVGHRADRRGPGCCAALISCSGDHDPEGVREVLLEFCQARCGVVAGASQYFLSTRVLRLGVDCSF
jgi:hypothetical protein